VDQFIHVKSPVREIACQTDLGGEELSSSLQSSSKGSTLSPTEGTRSKPRQGTVEGRASPAGVKRRSPSRGPANNDDQIDELSDEGSSGGEEGGNRYSSKAHVRVGGSRRRVPVGYGADGQKLRRDGLGGGGIAENDDDEEDEVTGFADGEREVHHLHDCVFEVGTRLFGLSFPISCVIALQKLVSGQGGRKPSRQKAAKAALSVDTVGDAEYLSWDPVTRQKKRLGQLMTSEPKLSRLEKLQKFRDRFRVPLVWRSLVGSEDGIKFPEGKVAPLNKVPLGVWQVMIDKVRSDATNQRDKLPCDGEVARPFGRNAVRDCQSPRRVSSEFPDFVANHLMFSFGTKGVVQDRLTSLITSLQEYIPVDNTCYMFARFCKLLDPVPLEAASTVLRVISVTFKWAARVVNLLSHGVMIALCLKCSCRFPLPVLPPPNKPIEIVFQLKRGLDALKTIGSAMKFANWRKVAFGIAFPCGVQVCRL
jgi:hypothetical protein